MPKPDKVLRSRPLKELGSAVAKLKLVVLFHPKPIVVQVPAKTCVCRQPAVRGGGANTEMKQCDECYEWYHTDCIVNKELVDLFGGVLKCEWCRDKADREGYHRWRTGRNRPKRRHFRDSPRNKGVLRDGEPQVEYSAPVSWEGKVEEIKELARRAAVKKRKLEDAAQAVVDGGGHHSVDAEGMAGVRLRPVDDGLIDELVGAGLIDPDDDSDEE